MPGFLYIPGAYNLENYMKFTRHIQEKIINCACTLEAVLTHILPMWRIGGLLIMPVNGRWDLTWRLKD
jgi:hypothetical protein